MMARTCVKSDLVGRFAMLVSMLCAKHIGNQCGFAIYKPRYFQTETRPKGVTGGKTILVDEVGTGRLQL